MKRIHIVGCAPRSGTTLMAEMMSGCFDIDLSAGRETRLTVGPCRRANIFLTKMPKDIILVREVLQLMKNFYVIYMLRDPRDIVVSRHPWDRERYWTTLELWKANTPFGEMLRDHPRFITVRYEDLVRHPDEVQQEIQRKMPFLERRELFSNFHKRAHPSSEFQAHLGGLRPVSGGSIGRWRAHRERVAGQIRQYGPLGDDLIALGYEKDHCWERELEDVVPDLSDSHPSRMAGSRYIRGKRRWNRLRAWRVLVNHWAPVVLLREVAGRLSAPRSSSAF